jgi:hypothetical protein
LEETYIKWQQPDYQNREPTGERTERRSSLKGELEFETRLCIQLLETDGVNEFMRNVHSYNEWPTEVSFKWILHFGNNRCACISFPDSGSKIADLVMGIQILLLCDLYTN